MNEDVSLNGPRWFFQSVEKKKDTPYPYLYDSQGFMTLIWLLPALAAVCSCVPLCPSLCVYCSIRTAQNRSKLHRTASKHDGNRRNKADCTSVRFLSDARTRSLCGLGRMLKRSPASAARCYALPICALLPVFAVSVL
jgi:hypothetical protein